MSHDPAALCIELALKSTLVAGCVLLLVAVLRRLAAAEKHLLLGAGLAALLILPLASAWLPRTPLPVSFISDVRPSPAPPMSIDRSQTNAVADPATSPQALPQSASSPAGARNVSGLAAAQAQGPTVAELLAAAYLLVAASLLAYFGIGAWRVAQLVRSLDAAPEADAHRLVDGLARGSGMRRRIRLLQSPSDRTPWAWGMVHPAIVLPRGFETWSADAQRNAIMHELAHIRRFDLATALLGHVCCALYWGQPLCWLLARRSRREAECACDDSVLLRGADKPTYARQLLDVAETIYQDGRHPPLVATMAARSSVSQRIESILDTRIRRKTVNKYKLFAALLVSLALAGPLATLKSQETGDSARASLADPAFQALLSNGPADDAQLGRIVKTLVANGKQARAAQVLTSWLTREDADTAQSTGCRLCSMALMNDVRPRSELTATVLKAFDAVENIAYQRKDGKLVLRLARLSLAARNRDATDRGLAYLVEAKVLGNAGDLRPTELEYLIRMGQFAKAKELVGQLNNDRSSSYYHSKMAKILSRYIDATQTHASRLSSVLVHPKTAFDSTEKSEYLPLYKPVPVYPEKASKKHEQGTVIVEYTVTPMGRTKDVHVLRSTNHDFDAVAVQSAMQYRYLPRIEGGAEVSVPGVRTKIRFVTK